MKKLSEDQREQLYIQLVKSLLTSYEELDPEKINDQLCIELIDGLDRLNASRINHLITSSDYLYDALRSQLVSKGMLDMEEQSVDELMVQAAERSLDEVLLEHEALGESKAPEDAQSGMEHTPETGNDTIILEDAVLGIPYSADLHPQEDKGQVYNALLEGIGPAEGLSFSSGVMEISGNPETTGHFIFQLSYLPTGALHRHQRQLKLTVQPNFDSLPSSIQLKHATAHEPYSEFIKLDTRDKFGFKIEGLQDTGLEMDKTSLEISGTPALAGHIEAVLSFKWKHPDGAIEGQVPVSIDVNPDDRRFWKEIPPEPNQPYPKSVKDIQIRALPHGRSLLGASWRGSENAHRGLHRNDDFKLGYEAASGWIVMSVADGLGDAPYSRKGSQLACKVAEQVVLKRLSEHDAREEEAMKEAQASKPGEALEKFLHHTLITATYNAYRYIIRFADSEGHPPEAFGTTFRLLIAKRLANKRYFIASIGIGDGLSAVYQEESMHINLLGKHAVNTGDGHRASLLRADLSGDTNKLRALVDWTIAPIPSAIVLATNGFTHEFFKREKPLDDVASWQDLWSTISKLRNHTEENQKKDLEELLKRDRETESDDRTLVIWI